MFPLNWNIPFIRKNGSRTTLGAITGDIAGLTDKTECLWANTKNNGAVNMLPYPYKRGNEVINGITSIVDSDGVITLNGTATAVTSFIMFERAENKFALPKGSYKAIVKIVSGTYTDTLSHILRATEDGSEIVKVDKNLGEAGIFSISTDTYIGYQVNIPSGSVLTNLKLAPMITVVSYNGDYVPYAKSNKELTEDINTVNSQISDLETKIYNNITGSDIVTYDSQISSIIYPYVATQGKRVSIAFTIIVGSDDIATWASIFTINSVYRPKINYSGMLFGVTSGEYINAVCFIDTNGSVTSNAILKANCNYRFVFDYVIT